MNNIDYFENEYSEIWKKNTEEYGYSDYEAFVVNKIVEINPESVFELGIGTGWPVAVSLKKAMPALKIGGCDIASSLVEMSRKNLPNDAEYIYRGTIDEYESDIKWKLAYCFRTSWYISSFEKAICNMVNMIEADGYIIFDIMNSKDIYHYITYIRESLEYLKRFLARIYHKIARKSDALRYTPRLRFYSLSKIDKILKKNNIDYIRISEKDIMKDVTFWESPKVIYICHKRG